LQDIIVIALCVVIAGVQDWQEIHHSDQGAQHADTAYVERLADLRMAISMAIGEEPEENRHAERLMRTIKEEVELSAYQDFADAYSQLGRFLEDVYNCKRVHSALGYLTSEEFEQLRRAEPSPCRLYHR